MPSDEDRFLVAFGIMGGYKYDPEYEEFIREVVYKSPDLLELVIDLLPEKKLEPTKLSIALSAICHFISWLARSLFNLLCCRKKNQTSELGIFYTSQLQESTQDYDSKNRPYPAPQWIPRRSLRVARVGHTEYRERSSAESDKRSIVTLKIPT